MVETYEDDLTEWYWHHQKENLTNWLCIERVLDPGEEGKAILWCLQFGGRGSEVPTLGWCPL